MTKNDRRFVVVWRPAGCKSFHIPTLADLDGVPAFVYGHSTASGLDGQGGVA